MFSECPRSSCARLLLVGVLTTVALLAPCLSCARASCSSGPPPCPRLSWSCSLLCSRRRCLCSPSRPTCSSCTRAAPRHVPVRDLFPSLLITVSSNFLQYEVETYACFSPPGNSTMIGEENARAVAHDLALALVVSTLSAHLFFSHLHPPTHTHTIFFIFSLLAPSMEPPGAKSE